MYSVYVYYSDDWEPYYVGKGQKNRRRAYNRNAHSAVNVPPISNIQHFYFDEEWEAFECEIQLINFWKRKCDGGCLLNKSTGGPGKPGAKCSPETIAKMKKAHKGKTISQEQREKISRTLKGRPLTEETKRKMSASRTGLKRSAETKRKMSEAHKKIWAKRRALKK